MGKKILWMLLGVLGIFVIFFGVRVYWFVQELRNTHTPSGFTASRVDFREVILESQNILVPQDAPSIGASQAALRVQVFCDFQCPYCGAAYPIIREFVTRHQDQVQLVFRHFPNEESHPYAGVAAVAAECAKAQGMFWPYHDTLFQHQDQLDPTSLRQFAVRVGLKEKSFMQCVQDNGRKARVDQDLAEALKLGVRGTPTWFINGKKVEGVLPLHVWEEVLSKVK